MTELVTTKQTVSPVGTTAAAAMKPIGKDTVHRLCSGQVVVDLATAVKELVENSLDAGATHVDIKMKDSGLAGITVSDNGTGISASDHATLCRKHWTSKISSFDDLERISTFGFRGEALSSLCAVATLTVTTSDSAPVGVQLEYDGSGELVEQTPVARERGTTVQLSGLFAKWPVRLQDLKKNIRREYMRAVALVEQYAIISDNARVSLTNQSLRGGSSVAAVRVPQGDRLTRLATVLGSQARQHLVSLSYEDAENALKIDGHISKPIPEAGRSAADKQYFYVNGRPCDFARAKRVVNEMYRPLNPTRYPVFAIAISISPATVDVNLTPDKRTLLIRHESLLLAALREALASVVEPSTSTYAVNRVQTRISPDQIVVQPTAVPGVSRCFVESSGGAEERALGAKRPNPELDDASLAMHGAKKQQQQQQQQSDGSKTISVQHYHPDAKENEPPQNTATPRKDAGAKTHTRRLPSCVIDLCKNRVQRDSHSWGSVRRRMNAKTARTAQLREDSQTEAPDDVERGGIASDNASETLSRLIHKHDFSRMHVVGQFNRGFIIARLDHDLYIIDQHASDEKYNFEELQQRAVIASQPLIRPARLELSIVDEVVAMAHKDTLMRNGFHIRTDEDEEPGHRVSLLSQPFIDQTLFDQSDLLELIGKLCVDPESMPRCERARKMFASRACRKSTMIGDPLGAAQMLAIVRHLSALDHPWNCPHGRPTMRHLHRLPA
ncbi:ATP-binding mismatch repair protein [Coemansia sp. RSA 2399]|nr:ATP-binding mismatch repair protein [Coemansia sp. RSA 2399]